MASFLDTLSEKAGRLSVGFLLLGEVRKLRRTLEIGIDTFRELHGLDPAFTRKAGTIDAAVEDVAIETHAADEPDWLRLDLIEHLAQQHHVPIDDHTDLLTLAKERGWMDAEGKLVTLPEGYGGMF